MSWVLWATLVGCGGNVVSESPVAEVSSAAGAATEPVKSSPVRVWLDVDVSAGLPNKDVDDAVALVQAFHSDELDVVGVSTVFGNAPLDEADRLAREVVGMLDPSMPVARGAAEAGPGAEPTEAVKALAAALDEGPLVVLALGPATNVAALLQHRPELASRIEQVVAVAGRRRGQRFVTGSTNLRGHRDFNFEKDPDAFRVLLSTEVPLTLAPWEVSSKVWLTQSELDRLAEGPAAARWLAAAAPSWLGMWKHEFAVDGFNPFDTLAVAVLTRPALLECEVHPVVIEQAPNDVNPIQTRTEAPKPYLFVGEDVQSERQVTYCFGVDPAFTEDLMTRLLKDPPR